MQNILNNKLHLKPNKAISVIVLTIVLLISIALPLLSLASATSATFSLSPISGPNGTCVKVSGTGFGASESASAFTITVGGLTGKVTTGSPLTSVNQLQTSAAGVLSGYIIIGGAGSLNLGPSSYPVEITDATSTPPVVSFTVTSPLITLSPSATGPAGSSVLISATLFPTSVVGVYTPSNWIEAATFAGTGFSSASAFSGAVTSGGTATTAGTLTLAYASTPVTSLVTTITTATITPSSAWTAAGTLTGTFTPSITGLGTQVATGSFTGTVPSGSVGGTTAATVTVTITIASATAYATTSSATTLSSNTITAGAYTGTVSLPGITTVGNNAFTLTDNYGNTGTAIWTLNTPTVILSPTSGQIGTVVTVTASGFGPFASFSNSNPINPVVIGTTNNGLNNGPVTVTDQGTAVFTFTVTGTTADYIGGSHVVTITDSKGNVATSSFIITPTAGITIGSAAASSGTAYAPESTATAIYVTASGYAPNTVLSLTGSGAPTAWLTFGANALKTNAAGQITVAAESTSTATTPAIPSSYPLALSDGINPVQTVTISILALPYFIITPTSGAPGTLVSLWAYDATAGKANTALTFGGNTVTPVATGNSAIWPAAPTAATLNVPTSGAGPRFIAASFGGTSYGSQAFNVILATSLSTPIPASVPPGTPVTIVGTGFANAASDALTLTVDNNPVVVTSTVFNLGMLWATFTTPNVVAGSHIIIAADQYGNLASQTFTLVPPSITVTPSTGPVGTAFAVTGSGFNAGEGITTTFDGGALGLALTAGCTSINNNGGILLYTGSKIPTSNLVAGAHTITVAGTTTGNTASFTFTVTPAITLTPSAIRPAEYATLTGNGFAASSSLVLTVGGTATSFYNPTTAAYYTTAVTTDGFGNVPANVAVFVPAGAAAGALNVTVTDAALNSKSATLTVLTTPSLTPNPAQVVSGSPAPVAIAGAGFSVGTSRAATWVLTSSSGVIDTSYVSGAPSTVTVATNTAGTNTQFSGTVNFNVLSGLGPDTYTLQLTLAASGAIPAETASTTLVVLGAATVVVTPSTFSIGQNVTITIIGLAPPASGTPTVYPITAATIGTTSILSYIGNLNVPTTGTTAYNLTTWFIVPSAAGITGGQYTLTVGDNTRSAIATITVAGAITLTPSTGIVKGTSVAIAGTGFGVSGTAFTATLNGASLPLTGTATTGTGGAISGITFTVPPTAVGNNTVVVTDALGNIGTATFTILPPVLQLTPPTGAPGSTVQVIGTGFLAGASVVVLINGAVATTAPATVTAIGGSFIAYTTIPTGLSAGSIVIQAIDASNNIGTANFTVGSGTTTQFTFSQTALSAGAQSLNSAGAQSTTFAHGSQVKFSFVLQTATGSGSVAWAITLQQGTTVYNIVNVPNASISTSPTTIAYTQFIPNSASAAGTWTATIQVYPNPGPPTNLTPLGVTTLTFTVT